MSFYWFTVKPKGDTIKPILGELMTHKQYQVLLDLYNEWNKEFQNLSYDTRVEFYKILHGHSAPT